MVTTLTRLLVIIKVKKCTPAEILFRYDSLAPGKARPRFRSKSLSPSDGCGSICLHLDSLGMCVPSCAMQAGPPFFFPINGERRRCFSRSLNGWDVSIHRRLLAVSSTAWMRSMMHPSTASIESSSCRVLIGPLSPIIIFSLSCEPAGRVSGPHAVPGGVVGLMGIELEVTFRVPQRIYLFIYCFLFYFSISFGGSLRCVRAAFFWCDISPKCQK